MVLLLPLDHVWYTEFSESRWESLLGIAVQFGMIQARRRYGYNSIGIKKLFGRPVGASVHKSFTLRPSIWVMSTVQMGYVLNFSSFAENFWQPAVRPGDSAVPALHVVDFKLPGPWPLSSWWFKQSVMISSGEPMQQST